MSSPPSSSSASSLFERDSNSDPTAHRQEHDLEEPLLPKEQSLPPVHAAYNIIMAPNEWKIGVYFLIAIVLWQRVVPYKPPVVTYKKRVYHYNEDWPWVKAARQNAYDACATDIPLLCGHYFDMETSQHVCGTRLGMLKTIWNVTLSSLPLPNQQAPYVHDVQQGNCLLSNLLPLPFHISQEQKDYVMQGVYTKLPPQDQALLQVLWYTWQQLYKLSEVYFSNPQDDKRWRQVGQRKLIQRTLNVLQRLLVLPDWQGRPYSAAKEEHYIDHDGWTFEEWEKLLKLSAEWSRLWSYSFFGKNDNHTFPYLPYGFYKDFLPLIEIDVKYLQENSTMVAKRKAHSTERAFPIFPMRSVPHRCLWHPHYEQETLLTPSCTMAMERSSYWIYQTVQNLEDAFQWTYGLVWCGGLLSWIILMGLIRERYKVEKRVQQQQRELQEMVALVSQSLGDVEDERAGGTTSQLPGTFHNNNNNNNSNSNVESESQETGDGNISLPHYFRKGVRQCRIFMVVVAVVQFLYWIGITLVYQESAACPTLVTILAWTLTYYFISDTKQKKT